jgi:hypothetical protein
LLFVIALWVRAAAKVGNWKVVNHCVWSLVRASALHLSNMENLEFLSGETFVDAGPLSGPVLNSRYVHSMHARAFGPTSSIEFPSTCRRQLWSVAGYLAMVHDVVFGLQTRDDHASGTFLHWSREAAETFTL